MKHGNALALSLALVLLLLCCALFAARPQAETALAPLHPEPRDGFRLEDGVVKIDINHASEAALRELPGVGEVLAQRIARYRAEHGAFDSVDALLKVPGIGQGKLSAIRNQLCVTRE